MFTVKQLKADLERVAVCLRGMDTEWYTEEHIKMNVGKAQRIVATMLQEEESE